ncbi:MAG: serine/threonine-protein kinase [Candidatus Competibacteraceae bacterium]|jgi:serine/threonine-protein kinase PpkA|nr:serine/threonine-protein kinase [Candidatus Competibacteraceae bacterium]
MNSDEKQDIPVIPGFTIQSPVGSGAMASVYLAVQDALEREIALKVMTSALLTDDTFRLRFLKEGKIIGQLTHPHITTIYAIGESSGHYYMAMEYIGAGTLKERIEKGLSVDRCVDILRQIASALGYAHKRGFVHRDVKPANILFRDDETAVLSDFGIARGFDENTRLTMAGWTLGTPNYMSPEQALGKTLDARSDLYALGVVFYEMLTGARPYQATDSVALALKHVSEPVPKLPPHLTAYQEIIERLLAKEPDDRFADADELIKAVTCVHETGTLPPKFARKARPAGDDHKKQNPKVNTPSPSKSSSKRWLWLSSALLIPLIGAGVYVGLSQSDSPAPDPVAPSAAPNASGDSEVQSARHIRIAEANLNVGFLVAPYTMNATHSYCEALKVDPGSPAALQGLNAVAEAYPKQPETDRDELAFALQMIEGCLKQAPDHPGLLDLRKQVSQQLGQ